jgi:hypothetical protein
MLLAAKVARIASHLDDEDDDLWDADAVPNLLLIEKLLVDLDAEIPARIARAPRRLVAKFELTDRRLRGMLAPLFAAIPLSTRRVVSALVAAGRAPSPFVRLARSADPARHVHGQRDPGRH